MGSMNAAKKVVVERVTIRSLIATLQTLDPDAAVAVSSDPEGNHITYLHNLSAELAGKVVVFWPMGHGSEAL